MEELTPEAKQGLEHLRGLGLEIVDSGTRWHLKRPNAELHYLCDISDDHFSGLSTAIGLGVALAEEQRTDESKRAALGNIPQGAFGSFRHEPGKRG